MTNAQTEARAIAQTSLWVPAKPEHAKLGWTYDFEQTECISRAAYDSTGYEATMEVVEFVMAEADRRHATALAAKDAELETVKKLLAAVRDDAMRLDHELCSMETRAERAEAQLAEANKALKAALVGLEAGCGQYATRNLHGGEVPGDEQFPWVRLMMVGRDAVRRACEAQGGENA